MMAQLVRPRYSVSQKAELWRQWKAGQSLSEIGRSLGKRPASIFGIVSSAGGIAPPPRTRSPHALSLSEREEISRGVAAGDSIRWIASALGRAPRR